MMVSQYSFWPLPPSQFHSFTGPGTSLGFLFDVSLTQNDGKKYGHGGFIRSKTKFWEITSGRKPSAFLLGGIDTCKICKHA